MKRHISIFTFLLGTFAAVGPLAAQAATTIQVTTFGVYHPGSDALDGSDAALKYFDPICTQRTVYKIDGAFPVLLKTIPPGWEVDYWLEQDSQCLRPSDYKGEKIDGTDGAASYTYTTDHINEGGVSYLAVKFKYITYKLAYNSAGGTPTPTGGTYSYDTQFQLAEAPSRTGYTFGGWRASSVGGTFAAGETVSGTDLCPGTWHEDGSNVTMIAQWTAHTYKVHFDGNGETSGSMEDQSFTYDEDAKELSANAFRKENYVFAGWATNATLGGIVYQDKEKVRNLTTNDNAIISLYARWTQMHEVTFKEHSMFGGGVLKVDHVKDGENAEPPSDPEHDGFKFLGWSKSITNVRQDLAVTAEYEGTPYYVVYHANDGSGRTTQQEFKHGVEKPLAGSTTFLRTGYTLKGWMVDATSTAPDYECGASVLNLTMGDSFDLYAFWKPISYSVVFDAHGGEGEMDDVTLDYGTPFEVPECKFTKTGCEFKSWQVLVNKVVVTNYHAGATVSNLTSKAGDIVTFRADWIGRYAVAFDGNGGEGEMTNVTYETGVEYALPSNAFTKTGYGFYGWATSKADADALKKPAYTNGQTVVDLADPGETFTLFAEWKTNRYTVGFLPGGATGTMEDQAFVYDQPQALRNCTFDRGDPQLWSFVGWTNSAAGGPLYTNRETVVNLTADPGGRVELTAVWKSELSDLALAMGCDNLNWTNKTAESVWKAGTVDFYGTDIPCVYASGSTEAKMQSSNFTTNGVLHFWWKADGPRESLSFNSSVQGTHAWRLDGGGDSDYTDWHETNIVVNCKGDDDIAYFSLTHRQEDSTCWIAKMTWTPEGSHPVPTDANKVTISSAAIADGKFTLSFKSDERFDYNLLTNANLLIKSWGIMANEKGTGGEITFKPQIIEGQSQLFYKVETIQKK